MSLNEVASSYNLLHRNGVCHMHAPHAMHVLACAGMFDAESDSKGTDSASSASAACDLELRHGKSVSGHCATFSCPTPTRITRTQGLRLGWRCQWDTVPVARIPAAENEDLDPARLGLSSPLCQWLHRQHQLELECHRRPAGRASGSQAPAGRGGPGPPAGPGRGGAVGGLKT